jgi:3-hydroxyisobutyrate dehydrogenase
MTGDRPPVGFVGLGAIGSQLAMSLVRGGCELAVHDSRAAAMEAAVRAGAIACESAVDVARRAETVMVSLPTPEVVRAVACEEGGLLEGGSMRTFVDLSTTGMATAREVAARLAEHDVAYLDAPVSGGVAGAEAGTLAVFAAAEQDVFERCRPLLETFSATIVRVGSEPGQGQVAKLLNNLLSATAMAITAEATTVGVGAGLDADALLAAFNSGSGRNTATAAKFPAHVLNRRFESGFRLELMLKDVRLALAEGDAQGTPMRLGAAVEGLWSLAAAALEDGADHTEIVRLFEAGAGVTVESDAAPADGGD